MTTAHDPWARWLLERRHGGDPERLRSLLAKLTQTRDEVLSMPRSHLRREDELGRGIDRFAVAFLRALKE